MTNVWSNWSPRSPKSGNCDFRTVLQCFFIVSLLFHFVCLLSLSVFLVLHLLVSSVNVFILCLFIDFFCSFVCLFWVEYNCSSRSSGRCIGIPVCGFIFLFVSFVCLSAIVCLQLFVCNCLSAIVSLSLQQKQQQVYWHPSVWISREEPHQTNHALMSLLHYIISAFSHKFPFSFIVEYVMP